MNQKTKHMIMAIIAIVSLYYLSRIPETYRWFDTELALVRECVLYLLFAIILVLGWYYEEIGFNESPSTHKRGLFAIVCAILMVLLYENMLFLVAGGLVGAIGYTGVMKYRNKERSA